MPRSALAYGRRRRDPGAAAMTDELQDLGDSLSSWVPTGIGILIAVIVVAVLIAFIPRLIGNLIVRIVSGVVVVVLGFFVQRHMEGLVVWLTSVSGRS